MMECPPDGGERKKVVRVEGVGKWRKVSKEAALASKAVAGLNDDYCLNVTAFGLRRRRKLNNYLPTDNPFIVAKQRGVVVAAAASTAANTNNPTTSDPVFEHQEG